MYFTLRLITTKSSVAVTKLHVSPVGRQRRPREVCSLPSPLSRPCNVPVLPGFNQGGSYWQQFPSVKISKFRKSPFVLQLIELRVVSLCSSVPNSLPACHQAGLLGVTCRKHMIGSLLAAWRTLAVRPLAPPRPGGRRGKSDDSG